MSLRPLLPRADIQSRLLQVFPREAFDTVLQRHAARGQLPCMICVEGARRRGAEGIEERTGVALTEEALLRQLNSLRRRSDAQRRRYAPQSECGTEAARRRHRRWQETCSTCGIRDGRSEATS